MAIGLIGCEDLRGEVPLRNDSPILRGEDLERVNKRPNGVEKRCRMENFALDLKALPIEEES